VYILCVRFNSVCAVRSQKAAHRAATVCIDGSKQSSIWCSGL